MKVSAIVTVAAAAVGAAAQAIPDGTPDCVVSWILYSQHLVDHGH